MTTPIGSLGSSDGLGRDAFLNLLVTQLQNQNPLEPQPDGAFLAQLAQFSTLEQVQGVHDDTSAMLDLAKNSTSPSNDGGA